MAFLKHPVHGNKTVDDSEVDTLTAQGWVQWPRKAAEKALGDGSAAGYWRAKFEAEAAKKVAFTEDSDDPENPDGEPSKRRGRPPKTAT